MSSFELNIGPIIERRLDAIAADRKAISSDHEFAAAHRKLATALEQQGRYAESADEQHNLGQESAGQGATVQ